MSDCLEQPFLIDKILEWLGAEHAIDLRSLNTLWRQRVDRALPQRRWLDIAPQQRSLRFWRNLMPLLPNVDSLTLQQGPLGFLKECVSRWKLSSLTLRTDLPNDPLDLDWPQSSWARGFPAGLGQLRTLSLSFATVGGLEHIAHQLPQLERLSVSRCQIYPEWHLPSCPLRKQRCSYDWLCICSPQHLHDLHSLALHLPRLRELSLGPLRTERGTDAPSAVLQVFSANCRNLERIVFQPPPVNGELREFLQRNALAHQPGLWFQPGWLRLDLTESTATRATRINHEMPAA
jgi:hypothetical protein